MHDYLEMIFDFSAKGKVMVNLIEFTLIIVTGFPEKMTALMTSLAAYHLFEVREELEAKPLLEDQAMAFHHTTARI